jgi:hypothetical protein
LPKSWQDIIVNTGDIMRIGNMSGRSFIPLTYDPDKELQFVFRSLLKYITTDEISYISCVAIEVCDNILNSD